MSISFSAILPGPFNPHVFLEQFEAVVEEIIDDADKRFQQTYATWEHDPGFDKDLDVSDREISGSVTTTDPIYGYVSRGTQVRYATMSPDFVAKTRVRTIGSFPGHGRVLYIDRKRPRPGIQARQFEEIIRDWAEPRFIKKARKAIDEAAKRSGHGF